MKNLSTFPIRQAEISSKTQSANRETVCRTSTIIFVEKRVTSVKLHRSSAWYCLTRTMSVPPAAQRLISFVRLCVAHVSITFVEKRVHNAASKDTYTKRRDLVVNNAATRDQIMAISTEEMNTDATTARQTVMKVLREATDVDPLASQLKETLKHTTMDEVSRKNMCCCFCTKR